MSDSTAWLSQKAIEALQLLTRAAASALECKEGEAPVVLLIVAKNVRTPETMSSYHYVVPIGTPIEVRGLFAEAERSVERVFDSRRVED